jgi:hypothetical protein
MRRPTLATFAVTFGLTLFAAGSALAAPVCLHDTVSPYYFAKMKLPKKPGQVTTFTGVRANGFARNATVTASRATGGAIQFTMHVATPSSNGNDFTMGWTAIDDTLAGTVYFDSDGDFVKDDGAFAMSIVDCSTVTLP